MMNVLAGMGLAGSAVLALWLLVSRLLKTRLPARWHYRILKTSLLFFLVPVGRILPLAGRALAALRPLPAAPVSVPSPTVPNIPVAVIPQAPAALPVVPAPAPVPAPEPFAFSAEALRVLAAVWAIGAAGMLAYKACVYFRLRRRVFRQNRPVSSREAQLVFWSCKRQLGIRGPVDLRENPAAGSPFAAGLRRPTVVIPAAALEQEELRYLFLHELTHIKCGDLWVRFGAMLAQVLHWYNPLAYLLCRNIQTISEQSCDERVACPLTAEERYVYGGVIMKLAAGTAAGSGDWAASLSTRESIERRLIRVLRTEKLKGCKRLLALALAAAILACGGGAALAARNPLPVSEKEAAGLARTVPAVSGEGTAPRAETDSSVPVGTAPTKEQVLAARSLALEGMSGQQIERLTNTVKTANLTLELAYLHDNIFGQLEDPDSFIWNYFDRTGEIQIGWAYDGPPERLETVCEEEGLTEEQFYAKYGTRVVTNNHYDADTFVALFGELQKTVRNETLKAELQDLMDETALAKETHVMEHANRVYKKLHDLDYFLLRYGPEDVGPYVEDDSTVTKYYGTLAFYGRGSMLSNGQVSAENDSGKPVTYNGTPSEEFLKELRERFGAAEDTPVLFGDHELIVSRGGTLLPDEEFTSYAAAFTPGSNPTCLGIYKQFYTKESGIDPQTGRMVYHAQEEYQVGNKDVLKEFKLELLKELVNGEYPVNSLGESYGSDGMSGYVGYSPDLIAALGTKNEEGYIYRDDEWRNPHNLPEDECPHEFLIPLYDKEHKEIGKFSMDCGGHMDFAAAGIGVDDAKAAVAAGATTIDEAKDVLTNGTPTYDDPSEETLAKVRESFAWADATANTPVLFGDKDLILSRGGTILPDNDPDSYGMNDSSIYKCFLDKNGMRQAEYLVGNKNALHPLDAGLLDSLTPDGDYPKNSKGESYGHVNLAGYVGYDPDMEYLAEYPYENRPAGYIYARDVPGSPLVYRTAEEKVAYMREREKNPGPIVVPLYNSEGEVIGEYSFGAIAVSPSTSGMSIEEAKAALDVGT